MRRAAHVVLCLVLFTAFMEGLRFLLVGIDDRFTAGMGLGVAFGLGVVALVTDRDYLPPVGSLFFLAAAIAASIFFGFYLGRGPADAHLPLGAFVGFGIAFPLVFWAVGNERAQRGMPRPPLFQRATPSRRR